MSDLVMRLRFKVDALRDRIGELEQDRETACWRIEELEDALDDERRTSAHLRQLVEAFQEDRRQIGLLPSPPVRVTAKPCAGCGVELAVRTPGCRQCSNRHSKRRGRFLRLVVAPDGSAA